MKHLGRLIVGFGVLEKALGLPEDCEILAVLERGYLYAVEIKVEHPDLPAVEEGTVIPVIHAVVEDGKVVGWD